MVEVSHWYLFGCYLFGFLAGCAVTAAIGNVLYTFEGGGRE
jgi:hypothetical protein